MRYTAYRSKAFIIVQLLFITAFGYLFSLFWHKTPLFFHIVFTVFIVGAAGICIYGLISFSPAIVADDSGLSCYKIALPLIEWPDIVDAKLLPKVRPYFNNGVKGTTTCIFESWRPIRLTVRNLDKYAHKLPRVFRGGFRDPENPDLMRLDIEYAGLSGSSAELFKSIEYYRGLQRNP